MQNNLYDISPEFPEAIGDLRDVDAKIKTGGQVLAWDSTLKKWKATSLGGGGDMLRVNNLSDLENVSVARTNLGLGDAALKNVGTTEITVAAGKHTHQISDIAGLADILSRVREQWENLTLGDAITTAPETEFSPGTKGDEVFSDGYYYVCVANNHWVRMLLSSWNN